MPALTREQCSVTAPPARHRRRWCRAAASLCLWQAGRHGTAHAHKAAGPGSAGARHGGTAVGELDGFQHEYRMARRSLLLLAADCVAGQLPCNLSPLGIHKLWSGSWAPDGPPCRNGAECRNEWWRARCQAAPRPAQQLSKDNGSARFSLAALLLPHRFPPLFRLQFWTVSGSAFSRTSAWDAGVVPKLSC